MSRRTESPEYKAWLSMKYRCLNPSAQNWHRYGGRGIRVCAEWAASFDAFLGHVGPRPSASHSIDRIDNDGHYEPGNVRWATAKQQMRNRSNTRYVETGGVREPLTQVAERAAVCAGTVITRVARYGWPCIEAVSVPAGRMSAGERHYNHKLSAMQVAEIVRRGEAGDYPTAIARDFNVSRQTVGRILDGRSRVAETGIAGRPLARRLDPGWKMTFAKAEEARKMRADGARVTEVACRFGLSLRSTYKILSGESWSRDWCGKGVNAVGSYNE